MQIKTVRSGHAGSHGEFVWADNAASSDDFGRDIPAHITGYDVVKYGTSANKYQYPNSIALDDGSLYIVVYAKESTWLTPRIYAYKRTESNTISGNEASNLQNAKWQLVACVYG